MAGRPWGQAKDRAKFLRELGISIPAGTMDRSDPKGTLARLDAIWEASPQRREMGEAVKARLRTRGLDPDKPETWPFSKPLSMPEGYAEWKAEQLEDFDSLDLLDGKGETEDNADDTDQD